MDLILLKVTSERENIGLSLTICWGLFCVHLISRRMRKALVREISIKIESNEIP